MLHRFAIVLGLAVSTLAGGLAAAETGTLKGRLVYDGKAPTPVPIKPNKDVQVCAAHPLVDESLVVGEDGGLKNVVIYVRTKDVPVDPAVAKEVAAKNPVLDNAMCRFEPHVVGVFTDQTLVLKNSDPVGHNSKIETLSPGNPPANPLIPAGGEVEHKFNEAESLPVKVSCNIHPWMNAYVIVRDNPYFAVSDEHGNFEIKGLPAGQELEFQLWHEKAGYLKNVEFGDVEADRRGRIELEVKAGENDLGTAKVDPKTFER